jgi:hypothetical protein
LNFNNTYRAITAAFLIAAITQVFILQSIHSSCDHHEEQIACNSTDVHFHSLDEIHLDCDLCLYQLSPSEPENFQHDVQEFQSIKSSNTFIEIQNFTGQKLLQNQLRGPPSASLFS